jgi:enoyl-CoA hydratase
MSSILRHECRGRVALLTLDRPERLNAIGSDTVALLHEALDLVEADSDTRAIVITGEGRAFSAGADIAELDTMDTGADFARFVTGLTEAFGRLAACATPSIAAINGIAFGGGCELALACDLRVASSNARLGVPEVKLGLLPGASGTQRLARLLPTAIVKHLLMTGAALGADRALELGLINSVADDVVGEALAVAARLAEGPPLALAAAKRLVDDGVELPFDEAVVLERSTVSGLFDTDDRREGIAAFNAKRAPSFSGR